MIINVMVKKNLGQIGLAKRYTCIFSYNMPVYFCTRKSVDKADLY